MVPIRMSLEYEMVEWAFQWVLRTLDERNPSLRFFLGDAGNGNFLVRDR